MRKHLKNHFIPHEGNDFKPHFVREKNVVSIGLVAIAIFSLAFSVKQIVTRHPDLLSAVITSVLVDLTNSNRLNASLAPLEFNPVLAQAAQLKANDMAAKGYFAHVSPDGKSPWYWFSEGGYQFIYAGENLAVNFVDSEDVVRAWMNSEGHKANIMNDKFTEIGIAMAPGKFNGEDSIYVVQLFGRPAPTQVATTPNVIREETPSVPILAEDISVSGAVAAAETGQSDVENVQVLSESEMFIAVQNNDFVETPSEPETLTANTSQSSVVDRALASPKMLLKIIYSLIGVVVLAALILFLVYKPSKLHNKHAVYVTLLFGLIVGLLYLSSTHLFPQILVG